MTRILMTKSQADKIEAVLQQNVSHDGVVCIVDNEWIDEQRGWKSLSNDLVGVQLHYSDRPGWDVLAYDRSGLNVIRFSGGLD